jgi:tRNA(Ile)-lysidine synthase
MRLFRGSGPSGLAGIPPKRAYIIRPLIEVNRRDIQAFLDNEGVSFVTDSSNLRDDYMRNRLRHHLLPMIRTLSTEAERNILRTAEIFRDEERYFEIQVTKTLMRLISRKRDSEIELFLAPLEALDSAILRRVLRRAIDATRGLRGVSLDHIEDIVGLIRTGRTGSRLYLPGHVRIIKSYATLVITGNPPPQLSDYILDGPGAVVLREASLVVTCRTCGIEEVEAYGDGKRTALFDADKMSFPVVIRRRKPGDSFYPFGLGKRKKIQDLFVDEKIPRDERDVIPLLISDGNIAWVIGYRMDGRFQIDKSTKRVLKYEVGPMKT